jgi:hypothetical protein
MLSHGGQLVHLAILGSRAAAWPSTLGVTREQVALDSGSLTYRRLDQPVPSWHITDCCWVHETCECAALAPDALALTVHTLRGFGGQVAWRSTHHPADTPLQARSLVGSGQLIRKSEQVGGELGSADAEILSQPSERQRA